MPQVCYFNQTREVQDRITDFYDFLWPAAAAMWNLRWQVRGYIHAVPTASQEQILNRFVTGAGLHGVNLRRACVEKEWSEQMNQFARFLLVDICAMYEGWLEAVLGEVGLSSHVKQCQFPTTTTPRGLKGVGAFLAAVSKSESSITKAAFYPVLSARSAKWKTSLEPMLLCYRYFKEIRNTWIHGGGVANQKVIDCHAAFSSVASTTDLGVKEVPEHLCPVIGQPIQVSMRGIVGLSDIVRRIILVLDAETCRVRRAEDHLANRWNEKHGRGISLCSTDPGRRRRQIISRITKLGLPVPSTTDDLDSFLRGRGLAH